MVSGHSWLRVARTHLVAWPSWRRIRAAVLAVTSVGIATGLTGCLDIEGDIKLTPDGGGSLVGRLVFEREVETVFAAAQAFARLHKESNVAILSRGICASAGAVAEQESTPIRFVLRQYISGDKLICDFATTAPQLNPTIPNPDGLGIFTAQRLNANTWRITLDLDKVPDLVPFLSILLKEALGQNPRVVEEVPGRDLVELTEKLQAAATTVASMALRDHHVQLAFSGARIVEAEGATSNDGVTAVFRIPIREVLKLATDQQARLGRKLSVTIEY